MAAETPFFRTLKNKDLGMVFFGPANMWTAHFVTGQRFFCGGKNDVE
jgi:hypothetical protein